jgi:shikimate dehydrogenase
VTFEPTDPVSAVEGADALGIAGLNVTIPYKRAVLEAVEPDVLAQRVGAVNTVDLSGAHPTGHNTDVVGVQRAFAHHDVALEGQTAVLIGAGGAGRAVAVALRDAGARLRIHNRIESKAEALAADVDATWGGIDRSTLVEACADADVLVNATSVGMESDETPVPSAALHPDLTVMDAVYRPLETQLLSDATAAGAETIDGAWMLLFQGVAAFERWTGRDAPVDVMNAALRAHLE